ncbi:SEC14-like protein 2, partial [Stegodyphus mimosarum]
MTLEEYTLEEKEAIEELRRRLEGEMSQEMFEDDNMFIRFLRARNFNMNAAETMLRNHIAWRKANNIDTILTDYTLKEVVEKYLTLNRIGFDKEGSPVLYSHFGNLDTKGMLKSIKKSDAMKSIVRRLETDILAMKEESAKRGKTVDKWIYIFNFENFSFSTATHKQTLDALSSLVTMYEANYPERLKAGYLINVQFYFTLAFSVIKPFLSGPTIKKINIFGRDGWKEALLKNIDADVLPAFLGGTRTDPDGNPACKTFINYGGLVPEHYYIRRSSKQFSQLPGIKKYTITRMSKIELIMTVTEPGSYIEWEFETKSKDIGFSLLYKEDNMDNSKVKELIPKQRIDTYMSSEMGMYKCERPGIYIIVFDNSYSWMFQKEVYCKA